MRQRKNKNRTHVLSVRLSPQELAQLEALAESSPYSGVSELARDAIFRVVVDVSMIRAKLYTLEQVAELYPDFLKYVMTTKPVTPLLPGFEESGE